MPCVEDTSPDDLIQILCKLQKEERILPVCRHAHPVLSVAIPLTYLAHRGGSQFCPFVTHPSIPKLQMCLWLLLWMNYKVCLVPSLWVKSTFLSHVPFIYAWKSCFYFFKQMTFTKLTCKTRRWWWCLVVLMIKFDFHQDFTLSPHSPNTGSDPVRPDVRPCPSTQGSAVASSLQSSSAFPRLPRALGSHTLFLHSFPAALAPLLLCKHASMLLPQDLAVHFSLYLGHPCGSSLTSFRS